MLKKNIFIVVLLSYLNLMAIEKTQTHISPSLLSENKNKETLKDVLNKISKLKKDIINKKDNPLNHMQRVLKQEQWNKEDKLSFK